MTILNGIKLKLFYLLFLHYFKTIILNNKFCFINPKNYNTTNKNPKINNHAKTNKKLCNQKHNTNYY